MNSSLFLIVSLVGGIISTVSFFLPWVRAQFIQMILPIAGPMLGLVNQELKQLVEQFGAYSSITGFQAVFTVNVVGSDLRILVVLPTVLGILAIVGGVMGALWPQSTRLISGVLAIGGVVLVGFLVFSIPNISRLGYGDNWMAAMALSLLGFAPAVGFWGSLFGVFLVCLGAGLSLFLGETGNAAQPDEFL